MSSESKPAEAGPEMDAAVARALGWTLDRYDGTKDACTEPEKLAAFIKGGYSDGWTWSGNPDEEAWAFQPSRRIESAFLVVEKLRERGDVAIFSLGMGSWIVQTKHGKFFDPSLPLAICLAALATSEPPL
jgi:hypothetical protein